MQRFIIMAALICLFACTAEGGDGKTIVASSLRAATVYRSGAELFHTAAANLTAGNNELIIEGISNSVDINSLQVASAPDIAILSVEYAADFLKPLTKAPGLRTLEDSLQTAERALAGIQSALKTDFDLLDLLKANKQMGGQQTGLSVAELSKMVDYYKNKMLELQHEISSLKEKEKRLLETVDMIRKQISEEMQKESRPAGRLILQVSSPASGKFEFNISYLSQSAYWNPFYDIRVNALNKPASLVYRARLVQTSGIDWKRIKLSLSTSLPNQSGDAPVFKTWFLRYNNPVSVLENRLKVNAITPISNEGTQASRDTEEMADSVAISDPYFSLADRELNVTYDIDLPYDVPGNGKEQTLTLRKLSVPVQYRFYAVPKLDRDAFLLAEVPAWEKLNLLPGQANILLDDTYVGKSFIDPHSTQDTLNLTLGRDKRLVVKREKLLDYSSTSFFGNFKKQVFTYEITLKNNKKENVELLLKDQYPISTDKDIEVELLKSDKAVVNAETGVLNWSISLAPGETKKVIMSYSVKYPKGRMVM